MKLHERTMRVGGALADLRVLLIDFQEKHDLTDIEMLSIVNSYEATHLKYMLRAERHPDDPHRGADEAGDDDQ
ncbi:hypothetical protein [Actinomadura litoris]|uniref:Uncharacterized protein n=1 Tax=Actinomadura litoris TaxID=2678616 RepID=A0A7K1LB72_9ACTN|nr:hypothetical protein [Actinomadura litoris]MUN41435.1 hypothetical protein [Actinomadura litoris]